MHLKSCFRWSFSCRIIDYGGQQPSSLQWDTSSLQWRPFSCRENTTPLTSIQQEDWTDWWTSPACSSISVQPRSWWTAWDTYLLVEMGGVDCVLSQFGRTEHGMDHRVSHCRCHSMLLWGGWYCSELAIKHGYCYVHGVCGSLHLVSSSVWSSGNHCDCQLYECIWSIFSCHRNR